MDLNLKPPGWTGEREGDGMIRIGGLSLPLEGDLEQLRARAARALGVRPGALETL